MSPTKKRSIPSIIGAIGVVYGDIGTSPLYALKSCFLLNGIAVNEANILGLISLFVWALLLIVTLKYVNLILKVNNQGEGGILVLSTLCSKLCSTSYPAIPFWLGIIGAALFFGDGVITPAISVLSALEGLHLITEYSSGTIGLFSIILLTFLFGMQKIGTNAIGKYFGPIMIIWFLVLGILGFYNLIQQPTILKALNPYYALQFLFLNGFYGFLAFSGTILVVTGAEALYADLGHFGEDSIRFSWNFFVFPALLLNYLGQGGLLLKSSDALSNPFYLLAPSVFLYPLIILATITSIIASQSIITGVFSISWQAIMLNYLPRMRVTHTSQEKGQVYVPTINYLLCALTIGTVFAFGNSERLAAAYGLSVSCVMLITTIMVYLIALHQWQWRLHKILFLFIPLLFLDLIFVSVNIIKIWEGAWYTLVVTCIVSYTIKVWIQGSQFSNKQKLLLRETLEEYLAVHEKQYPQKIPGTAIFMSRSLNRVPSSLIIHLKHNKFLHEKLIFISVITEGIPKTQLENKFSYHTINSYTNSITARYGFMEIPDLHQLLNWAQEIGIIKEQNHVSFFLSKGIAVSSLKGVLTGFSEMLYIYLSRNSAAAYEFYHIPDQQIVELGVRYRV